MNTPARIQLRSATPSFPALSVEGTDVVQTRIRRKYTFTDGWRRLRIALGTDSLQVVTAISR